MTDQPKRPKGKTGRKVYRTALELPIPPSVNQLWRYSQGRVHRSAEYVSWLEEAGWTLKAQRPISIPSPVAIRLKAGLPDRPRDLDNLAKAVCDLLQAHTIIENDNAIVDLQMKWDRVVEPGRVLVSLWRTTPPARRIGAETRKRVSVGCRAAFAARRAAVA